MIAEGIYSRAENNGVYLECSCVGIGAEKFDELMLNSTRADRKRVEKILIDNGYLKSEDVRYYNPYSYYKTNTHLVYVHSSIEYFYKIN